MRPTKQRKNWAMRTAAVLLCLTMLTTYLTAGLYARYTSSDEGGDSARTAAFVFDVQEANAIQDLVLEEINRPGTENTYYFEVTNDTGVISEVAQQYTVEITVLGNLPIECTLQQVDTSNAAVGEAKTVTSAAPGSLTGQMAASESSTTRYMLHVEWPAQANDLAYARKSSVAVIQVKVDSEQID